MWRHRGAREVTYRNEYYREALGYVYRGCGRVGPADNGLHVAATAEPERPCNVIDHCGHDDQSRSDYYHVFGQAVRRHHFPS